MEPTHRAVPGASDLTLNLVQWSQEGEPLLMLPGNPTWSFYWRRLVAEFRHRYRVVVPDHMGCGMSDKPQQYPYHQQRHIDMRQNRGKSRQPSAPRTA